VADGKRLHRLLTCSCVCNAHQANCLDARIMLLLPCCCAGMDVAAAQGSPPSGQQQQASAQVTLQALSS
jgi:hypothetical protein